MHAQQLTNSVGRRGVVLVLILAMLGLLALIGVSFATITGQAQTGSRNFAAAAYTPSSDQVMDFALAQLINDTTNPLSAIRGHSLRNDMYGNDAYNADAIDLNGNDTRGRSVTNASGTVTLTDSGADALAGFINHTRYATNIQVNATGDLTRWIIRITAPGLVSQTLEVLRDDRSRTTHTLTLSNPDTNANLAHLANASLGLAVSTGAAATLDGRFQRAFNGPGANGWSGLTGTANFSWYGNFRVNGDISNGNLAAGNPFPGTSGFAAGGGGMDEDYDAVDTENWFLAMQSADGSVVVPSFHRPGILTAADWKAVYNSDDTRAQRQSELQSMAKILRPRAIDHPGGGQAFPDLTGGTFDVDNDGDGKTDSVWLDLGYPPVRDAAGKLSKPLFALTVLGTNGRLPLNTAGNLQGRQLITEPVPVGDTPSYYAGDPTFNHTSHLGASPSEINPLFALQNAPDPSFGTYSQFDNSATFTSGANTYYAGVPVSVTQLRNILTGTRMPATIASVANDDANLVIRDGQLVPMGNNIVDATEVSPVVRATPSVAGRWGEDGYVPTSLQTPVANPYPGYYFFFNNTIRAGRTSFLPSSTPLIFSPSATLPVGWDAADDNFTTFDFVHALQINGPEDGDYDSTYWGYPTPSLLASERSRRYVKPADPTGTGRLVPYTAKSTDLSALALYNAGSGGQVAIDPAAGQRLGFGTGPDAHGRLVTWGYFRPPGLTPTMTYPAATANYNDPPTFTSPTSAPDISSNPFHGLEAERNPAGDGANLATGDPTKPIYSSARPSLVGDTYPTFSGPINTVEPYMLATPATDPPILVTNYGYPGGSLGLNEADEMDLYNNSPHDSPFGPQDLEWLYRKHDVDGASLDSRLAYLAPISFLNSGSNAGTPRNDGMTRRNIFTTDTWDTNALVLANDNPMNNIVGSVGYGTSGVFPANSRLLPSSNNSLDALLLQTHRYDSATGMNDFPQALNNQYIADHPDVDPANPAPPSPPPRPVVATPSIAHRDRKINLNFPLPVSCAPDEPVRKKWIGETYQLLLDTLPPDAIDTPEERVQLCQYVVNIVDFRDPDGAMTHFVMPDVRITPATTTAPSTAIMAMTQGVTTGYDNSTAYAAALPLDLYGMEYCPIAINEVLAYSFKRSGGVNGTDTPRFFVELTNTLTASAAPPAASIPAGYPATWNPSDVDLTGWDLVIATESTTAAGTTGTSPGEDFTCRPDPLTGQIPPQATATPADRAQLIYLPLTGRPVGGVAAPYLVPAIAGGAAGRPSYLVLSNASPDASNQSENAFINGSGANHNTPNIPTSTTNPGALNGILTRTGIANPNVAGGTYPLTDDPFAPSGTVFTTTAYNATSAIDPANTLATNIPQTNTDTLPATPLASGAAKYYWLYLRRPANPLAGSGTGLDPATNAPLAATGNPMVVVDSVRFPFIEAGVKINTAVVPAPPPNSRIFDRSNNRDIYSVQRIQPYRGGHMIPTPVGPPMPYGYTEQSGLTTPAIIAPVVTAGVTSVPALFGIYQDPTDGTKYYQTTGKGGPATPTQYGGTVNTIGGIAFSPSLVGSDANAIAQSLGHRNTIHENWDHFAFHDRDFMGVAELLLVPGCPPGLFTKKFVENPPVTPLASLPNPTGAPFTTPPLVTSASAVGQSASAFVTTPRTYPYLNDNFYYSAYSDSLTHVGAGGYTPVINGRTGAGWHKMLGLFEVPSPAINSIGPVSQGQNFDWYRQDRKPGLINLNLIIDEEVFFGLIDDPLRMNLLKVPPANVPQIATSIGSTSSMGNRGFQYFIDGVTAQPKFTLNAATDTTISAMKSSFRDFLGHRHSFNVTGTPVLFSSASERPFHDLTYPDIDYTVMRPALLQTTTVPSNPPMTTDVGPRDPGIKSNDATFNAPPVTPGTAIGPPPIPARRLFEIPTTAGNSDAAGDPAFNANAAGFPIVDLSSTGGTSWYGSVAGDNRQHPVFQTEWLQKIMNLSTVRTHQFAVWVTVGFFEVTRPGNAATNTPDQLGREIGAREGRSVRYRSFFLLDRTKATGFNPQDPGDFRDVVLYRRRIE